MILYKATTIQRSVARYQEVIVSKSYDENIGTVGNMTEIIF